MEFEVDDGDPSNIAGSFVGATMPTLAGQLPPTIVASLGRMVAKFFHLDIDAKWETMLLQDGVYDI